MTSVKVSTPGALESVHRQQRKLTMAKTVIICGKLFDGLREMLGPTMDIIAPASMRFWPTGESSPGVQAEGRKDGTRLTDLGNTGGNPEYAM